MGDDMTEPSPRFMQIFFEVFETLPRQGPGNRASTAQALAQCRELPSSPSVIDLGCGIGGQTLHLAELTPGSIVAVDSHAPSIDRLRARVAEQGLSQRISPVVGNLSNLEQPASSFDLVWSKGALYNIGLGNALGTCHRLLRPGGYLAFTDAVWRNENPPPEVKAIFDSDYPTMGRVPDALALIESRGFSLVDHFTLPDEAWWDEFYTPMQDRIEELRRHYADDEESLAVLGVLAEEPGMYEKFSDYFAYEFFVTRRVE
jgi:ubiquinone/menaquinone biosynthesis C-methylase UbiE